VSVRCDPRFTRDVDLAIAVSSDEEAESVGRLLGSSGFRLDALAEQEAVGRLAMVRLIANDGTTVDMLTASSGIEAEVVADAEILEVTAGTVLSVARVGHLIALKLLSVSPGRETDMADLRNLAIVADDEEWDRAERAVARIEERGFSRGRDLRESLRTLRAGQF
jgi:predicted nucleotidyltransferase